MRKDCCHLVKRTLKYYIVQLHITSSVSVTFYFSRGGSKISERGGGGGGGRMGERGALRLRLYIHVIMKYTYIWNLGGGGGVLYVYVRLYPIIENRDWVGCLLYAL